MLKMNGNLILLFPMLSLACDLFVAEEIPAVGREVPIPRPGSTLLLHSTMDSAQDIFHPTYATAVYSTLQEAIPGPAYVSYEPGMFAYSTRFEATGYQSSNGPVRFRGDNFDFDDTDDDGGRMDFWIKFNVDPHAIYKNTWVARSNYPGRYINYEFAGSNNTPTWFMIDVYGDVNHNNRTNFQTFRVSALDWSVYENIKQGEWHLFTTTWRRNGGPHKAELHFYIDGTQAGCRECNDYNGNLPPGGGVADFYFSPPLYGNVILFSVDEVYSFDRWDVSGETGNFADLQIPEGVTVTYPMSLDVWGRPVPEANVVFEFFVVNYVNYECECDLYVDGVVVNSVVTTSQAHTELADPAPLTEGNHTCQVKCDNNRLISPLTPFVVNLP